MTPETITKDNWEYPGIHPGNVRFLVCLKWNRESLIIFAQLFSSLKAGIHIYFLFKITARNDSRTNGL